MRHVVQHVAARWHRLRRLRNLLLAGLPSRCARRRARRGWNAGRQPRSDPASDRALPPAITPSARRLVEPTSVGQAAKPDQVEGARRLGSWPPAHWNRICRLSSRQLPAADRGSGDRDGSAWLRLGCSRGPAAAGSASVAGMIPVRTTISVPRRSMICVGLRSSRCRPARSIRVLRRASRRRARSGR